MKKIRAGHFLFRRRGEDPTRSAIVERGGPARMPGKERRFGVQKAKRKKNLQKRALRWEGARHIAGPGGKKPIAQIKKEKEESWKVFPSMSHPESSENE